MTIVNHELKQERKSLLIWTVSIAFLLAICIFMFPSMKSEMGSVSDMFSSMGSFTAAFGMDRINFGSLTGFYSIECGNIVGLGGAFFAALLGVTVLSKEEKEHTAEFLFTHPISRKSVLIQKLVSVFIEITVMNILVWLIAVGSIAAIGEEIPWKEINLIHLSYFLMQIELSCICFGISAFIRSSAAGIGLGIAILMYFLNIISNISDGAHFIKYITPFGYTEGADIILNGVIDGKMLILGAGYSLAAIVLAFIKYTKKDLR